MSWQIGIDIATSRAHAMKRSTTGLKVRFRAAHDLGSMNPTLVHRRAVAIDDYTPELAKLSRLISVLCP